MQWLWNLESNQSNLPYSPRRAGLSQAVSLQTLAGQAFASALVQYNAAAREEQLAPIYNLISTWGPTAEFGTLQTRAAAHGYTFNYAFVTGDRNSGGDLIVDGAMLITGYYLNAGNGMCIILNDAIVRAANDSVWRYAA